MKEISAAFPANINSASPLPRKLRRRFGAAGLADIVLGLVLIGIAYAAALGMNRTAGGLSANQIEAQNLTGIVASVRSLRENGSYAGIDNAAVQRIQGFGNMIGSAVGGTVRNKWNGLVTVTGTVNDFSIIYAGVPASACPKFLIAAKESGDLVEPYPTCAATGDSSLTFKGY